MAKYDAGNFIGGFGEGFLKTLQSERERKQKEQEFNQKMAFETRQMNLLDAYRQKQIEMEGSKPFETKTGEVYPSQGGVPNFEKPLWTPPEAPTKPQTFDIEGSYKNPETGTYWTFDKNEGKPRDLGIPYDKNENRSTTNVNMGTPSEPYTDTKDLDEAWENYQTLQEYDKNWQNLENKPKDKDGNVLSYEQIKAMKNKAMTNIERLTKDRSKKINEEYTGFNAVFNDLLRDPNYKNATDKNAYISRIMAGFPEEAIRQMKDLVSKRIF